ncbi:nuclear transport factor 2 family protein [Micromonospora zhanjiangensis]|uniref:Nuclear transport factor 2 family protein n=1 Tax=Micromonospora zhanjiangensis TaxID=1522057 RepID=A0ABV8KS58_9ACTN
MDTRTDLTPGDDLAGYLTSYAQEMAFGAEEPETILDRYHTPDFVLHNDGLPLDRQRLLDHVRPVRKQVRRGKITDCRVDVHQTLVAGAQVAGRYTLTAVLGGKATVTEIYMFGELAPDGRLRRIDQVTRVPGTQQAEAARLS